MNVVGTLVAFGLRQVIGDTADQVVDYAGQALPYARPVFTAVKKCFTDHSQALPHALARANDRAWQAVGLALVGDGLFDRVKDLFRDGDLKGVRDQIKAFLAATPTGLEGAAAGADSRRPRNGIGYGRGNAWRPTRFPATTWPTRRPRWNATATRPG